MPSALAVIAPIASPILGSNPNSNVQRGSSMTPSSEMNSCTLIRPMSASCRLLAEVDREQAQDSSLAQVEGRLAVDGRAARDRDLRRVEAARQPAPAGERGVRGGAGIEADDRPDRPRRGTGAR